MTIRRDVRNSTMADVNDLEFRQMKKFMNDSFFTHTDEWLVACMRFIKEDNRNISFELWKREVSEQWKDANLQEMESSCLPPNLSAQRLVKLPGKYGLQVNCIRDIGESSYSQWTKLKKLENENVSVSATDSNEYTPTWQPTPKRCLHLTMTDGTQGVFGLEMQPISALSLTMKPGLKVLILGPVDCRRGVLHLKPNNIKVIGGEVEDLLEANRVEKTLADTLKLTPNAASTQQATRQNQNMPDNPSMNRNTYQGGPSQTNSTNRREEVMGDFPDSEDAFPDIGGDDEIFMEIDEEALLRSASNASTGIIRNSASASSRSTGQMTTQKMNDSSSMIPTFTEEIEDFEEEELFPDSTRSNRITASTTPPASSMRTTHPTTSTSSSTTSTFRNPKPLFAPPLVRPNPGAVNNEKRPTGSATKVKADTAIVGPTTSGFKSAKSLLNQSSGIIPKQKNILEYMKPMPVVIDPPTPERQAKRRRKSEEQNHPPTAARLEQGVSTINEEEMSTLTDENMEPEQTEIVSPQPHVDESMEDDRDFLSPSPGPDDSLMRIVDETLESKLLETESNHPCSSREATKDLSLKAYPIVVSESPYVYLAQVQRQIDELKKKRKVVNVKACVSTVVSNIQVDNGCWTLCVCINDGTGYLNCKISANILTGIIGFTPAEMKKLKAEKTKEGKQKITEGMANLAKTLVHLSAIFAVELGEQHMITEIIDLKLNHSAALKSRLFKLGL